MPEQTDAWAQEYELQWLDEASAWLSYDLINTVEHERAGIAQNYAGGPCYVGVDIGRRHDLFVIWVLEEVGDVLWTREIITRRGASFAEQDGLLDDVFRRYRVLRCCMDQTGMGEKPVEDARRRHGSGRVEGVLFTSSSKLALATVGKQAFEDRRLRIPQGDEAPAQRPAQIAKGGQPYGRTPLCGRLRQRGPCGPRLGLLSGCQRGYGACRRPAGSCRALRPGPWGPWALH